MVKQKSLLSRILKALAILLGIPGGLFLLIVCLLYIPFIQRLAVDQLSAYLSDTMKMSIQVERVRLSFPLTLCMEGVCATEHQDTLLYAQSLEVDVAVKPLLDQRLDVACLRLQGVQVDTKAMIPDLHLKGLVGEVYAESRGIAWSEGFVNLNTTHIEGARLLIALGDTTQTIEEEPTSPIDWTISIPQVTMANSAVALSLPGDSMRVFAALGNAELKRGEVNLKLSQYGVEHLALAQSCVALVQSKAIIDSIPHLEAHFQKFFQHTADSLSPDFTYFADSLDLAVDSVSYWGDGNMYAHLKRTSLREQHGLRINQIMAQCYMDSAQISVPSAMLVTPHTMMSFSAMLPWQSLTPNSEALLRVYLDGHVGVADVAHVAGMVDMESVMAVYPRKQLQIQSEVIGNVDWMEVKDLYVAFPGMMNLQMTGAVANVLQTTDVNTLQAQCAFESRVINITPWLKQMGVVDTVLAVPEGAMLQGHVQLNNGKIETELDVAAAQGALGVEATLNTRSEAYKLKTSADQFSLASFLPTLPITPLTANIEVEGRGFDLTHEKAEMQLQAQIDTLTYANIDLNDIRMNGGLNQQLVDVQFHANNTALVADGQINAHLKNGYHVDLNTCIESLSLKQFAGAEKDLSFGTTIDVEVVSNEDFSDLSTKGSLCYNYFSAVNRSVMMKDIFFDFSTNTDTTNASVEAGDMLVELGTKGYVSNVANHFTPITNYLAQCIEQVRVNHDTLKAYIPSLHFKLNAGTDNPLSNILKITQYAFDTLAIDLKSTPMLGLEGDFTMQNLQYKHLQFDDIHADIRHGKRGVVVNGEVHNHKRKNNNKFKLNLNSYLLDNKIGADVKLHNDKGEVGFNIGLIATIANGELKTQFYPKNPIIAYHNFEINRDNYITINQQKEISANVKLEADDGTGLMIYSENADSTNDMTLSLSQLNLRELSKVLPYMPQLGGFLDADLHVMYDQSKLSAMGNMTAHQLKYEDVAIGNLGADVVYFPKTNDEHYLSAFVSTDGADVMECNGTYYNTEEGAFEGEAILNNFPLALVNGFLKQTDIQLQGTSNGVLDIQGQLDAPKINGEFAFNQASVYSDIYGFRFHLDEKPIRFENSEMLIDNFLLKTQGKEPLTLNGTLDLRNSDNVEMDFNIKGKNFELINTKRQYNSVAFGKLFVDVDCTLRGNTENIVVRGDFDVLNRTNLTYILRDSPLTVENQLEGLVEFVDFEQKTPVPTVEPIPETQIDLSLNLGINDAARFHCNLSEDGKSYVDVQGGGQLTLRMTQQGEVRLIGRLTVEEGEMKYALPVIPLKTFNIKQGSYIDFTGDIMNPQLNVHASERMKALVTEDDKQRSVAFDVGVNISKSLANMGLEFTIEAPEDLSLQNQIATMTPEQRSKTAISLMATGLYLAEGSMASGGIQANSALNAFLQSEIQNIAGSALKTVDINLGVENNTTQSGATTTDYSFQFSKRFFGNRVAINIGGRVSTGSEADNSAESIIDNVTVEYRLDKGATRYIQVFYDRSMFDPLEGQLSKMGTGIVLRKKTAKLGELFIFR
ncbi:MAG: translocation/assembly module TamB domain-containing protein [Bacteroidaceae bacterium]|nr:translocation/assembly module TamB domain-containing protein [Bacteroidaceae bacterium]